MYGRTLVEWKGKEGSYVVERAQLLELEERGRSRKGSVGREVVESKNKGSGGEQ